MKTHRSDIPSFRRFSRSAIGLNGVVLFVVVVVVTGVVVVVVVVVD